jgi:hypothetical protein
MTRKKGKMSFELFKKIIHECDENKVEHIFLNFYGECARDNATKARVKPNGSS